MSGGLVFAGCGCAPRRASFARGRRSRVHYMTVWGATSSKYQRAALGGARTFREIPVVDLSGLRGRGGGPDRQESLASLREACHQIGFMYVSGHGIPAAVLDRALSEAAGLFAQPAAVKGAMDNARSPAFRGFVVQGAENTGGVPDEREQVEIGVEGAGVGAAGALPAYKRLVGPNQWPDPSACPGFRPAVEEFMAEMEGLSRLVMAGLAECMGLPPAYFDPTFGDEPNVQMKVARYPPPPEGADGWSGVGAHSDSGYLSLLLQDTAGGLQVLNGAGEWVDAPPIPGTLVVNLGEMLQLVTGGFYLATVHRVQNRGPTERVSVPYFWNPRLDARIEPMPEEVLAGLPWARPRPAAGYSATHGGRNKVLPVYGDNAFKSLYRSHPRVVAAHHADLELQEDGRYAPAPPRAAEGS